MKRGEFIVRDLRHKEKYTVDDEYLNGYARVCGIYATGVYNVLCRHADFHTQISYPSVETMAEKLSISRVTVMRALKTLESYNIIKKERVRSADTARWKNNSYTLLDKSEWEPSQPQTHGAKSTSGQKPSQPQVKSQVNVVDSKVTHKKVTHSKDIYGEFQKVNLTAEEYTKLVDRFGEEPTRSLIEELDSYIASTGKRYQSHYATLLNWARRKIQEHVNKQTENQRTVL